MLKSVGQMEFAPGEIVGEAKVAELREKNNIAYYLYLQKKTRWEALFNEVDAIIMKPI